MSTWCIYNEEISKRLNNFTKYRYTELLSWAKIWIIFVSNYINALRFE